MGDNKQPNDPRSKFTPTGNEQGSAAVQRNGQENTPDNRQLEREEKRGSLQDDARDGEHQDQQGDAPGIFSALVGDGKDR